MHRSIALLPAICLSLGLTAGCDRSREPDQEAKRLSTMIARFEPTVITGDTTSLSGGDRAALKKLVEAAKIMDRLYLRQVWGGNVALAKTLEADTTLEGRLRHRYFNINMGPWSTIDDNEAFVDGIPQKPLPHANYYPEDLTREEFSAWLAGLPEKEQVKATGYFYTIRRNDRGALSTVPYSEEYREDLEHASRLLREAAALTDNNSLRTYLLKRADAFFSNDYYESDLAWMDLDSPIDVTIGPYEVYMDSLFNYKAAFEAFITLRNEEETVRLSMFSAHLQDIEDNLPINARYRNPRLGALAPIRVVDEIAVGGEAGSGVQTAAFNLPNDERVVAAKGSKRVMLRNVMKAKFEQILAPIAAVVLDTSQLHMLSFDAFFTHVLAHELMHGLGPQTIIVEGKPTTVRKAMKELGSALEEAKADIAGLFALQHLIDRGIVRREMERPMYVTFLAGAFRSVRFGIHQSHGKGIALQFNYLMDEGGIVYNETDRSFAVDFDRIREAMEKLTAEIMTVQARGDYDAARAMLQSHVLIRPVMQASLDKLASVPVDIAPRFPLAE
ncbi:MAG: hypothetical protein WBD30_06045 [Bacteroidota bacterium]